MVRMVMINNDDVSGNDDVEDDGGILADIGYGSVDSECE